MLNNTFYNGTASWVPLMPVIDSLEVNEYDRATPFHHKNETAKPHYYHVEFANGISTKISLVQRGSHTWFIFPESEEAYLVLDEYTGTSQIKIIPEEQKNVGYVHNGTFVPKNLKNYFIIKFGQLFVAYGTWENEKDTIQEGGLQDEGKGVGAYIQFEKDTTIQAKIDSSYIIPNYPPYGNGVCQGSECRRRG